MKHEINDTVTLLVNKKFSNGDSLKKGTHGTVIVVKPFSMTYTVNFTGALIVHDVHETEVA
jgi:hypothetical protein